jgi:hypothetical protein
VVFVRFNSCLGKAKPIMLKCQVDTGASGSLGARKNAQKLRLKQLPGQHSVWTTPAGNVLTTHNCRSAFVLPKFHRDKIIKWDLNISESFGAYNMIIGHDLLSVLGIKFDFTDMSMEWDDVSIPIMKDSSNSDEQNYYVQEPEALLDMTD